MILGGRRATRIRAIGYRGYTLWMLSNGAVQIDSPTGEVVCTEPSRVEAERVIDGWVANRGDS